MHVTNAATTTDVRPILVERNAKHLFIEKPPAVNGTKVKLELANETYPTYISIVRPSATILFDSPLSVLSHVK